MNTVARLLPWLGLLVMGVFWGLSFSFTRMAVENGGTPLGIAFWQSIISSVILLSFSSLRGRHFTMRRHHIGPFIIIALLGVGVPGVAFFIAASRVPSGILAITVTLVPILTYCMALSLRIEAFSVIRICGVFCGAMAILLLVLPSNSLPDAAATPWVLLACLSSLCYAAENIYLTRKTISDIGPIRIACGMNVMALVLLGPLALAFDQMFLPTLPFATLEWSLLGLGGISAIAYTLYVLTVKRYGPVFASQVGYLVTISGVFWGMAIFGEAHSTWVWSSLALMMIGLALVSPRQNENA